MSFKHSSSPPKDAFEEKRRSSIVRKSAPAKTVKKPTARPPSPTRTTTEPMRIPSKPLAVPTRSVSGGPQATQTMKSRGQYGNRRAQDLTDKHNSDALPPAVAALLAVTAIPPRRPFQSRTRARSSNTRRMSIDELVQEWKSEELAKPSYSSSPSLSMLLEQIEDETEEATPGKESVLSQDIMVTRSTSSESIPSLEADDRSVLSFRSPSTPGSLRSRKSNSNLNRREKARSLPDSEDCALDHPLATPRPAEKEGVDFFSISSSRSATPKPRNSFKSNLTSSLQALKNAALNSFSSLTASNQSQPSRSSSSPYSDDMLWSHPFLFPRFGPEIRPTPFEGTPTKAQRRYLNPQPLVFEEQEAPFRQALNSPQMADEAIDTPMIQMQTYSRNRRKTKRAASPAAPDPQSEAGRALLAASSVRQREPRENSDFLRIVVLEMNMRREGKLETGRARIWLPPRKVSSSPEEEGRVPRRWVGVSAE